MKRVNFDPNQIQAIFEYRKTHTIPETQSHFNLSKHIIECLLYPSLRQTKNTYSKKYQKAKYQTDQGYCLQKKIQSSNYYKNHYDNHKKYKQQYYQLPENIEARRLAGKIFREKNKNNVKWKLKKSIETQHWHANNPLKSKAQAKRYYTKKYNTDPVYNVAKRCRLRIRSALNGGYKASKTFDLIGCTPQELKLYLESKFLLNMSWQNRDKWHIDHIRPISSFNLLDPEQQRQCFHYTNLQPLWMGDNLAKKDKW